MTQVSNYYDTVNRGLLKGPLCIQMEISGRCVAKCVTCEVRNQGIEHHPSFGELRSAIINLKEAGLRAIRLTGGEPLMADNFPGIVELCKQLGIYVSMTTTLLTKKKENREALLNVDKFKVSLSAVGEEYHKFFGIDSKNFNIVRNNIDYLRENKRKFSINYTLFEGNCTEESLMNFINFINDYKPNYVTFFPALEREHFNYLDMLANLGKCSKYCRFKSNIDTVSKHFARRKPRTRIICYINKFHWHIKRNGDVYPCCMTGGEVGQHLSDRFVLGNIFKQDAEDIYRDSFDIFKGKNLAKNEICKSCTQRYLMLNEEFDAFINGNRFNEL